MTIAAVCAVLLFGNAPDAGQRIAPPGVWTSIGPFGGRIRNLVRNPKAPAELYAASESRPGQIWRSTNGGGSWKAQQTNPITDVTAVAADASNPKVLYAGGKFKDVRSALKSTDGGLTWAVGHNGIRGALVDAFAVAPSASNVIIAGIYGYAHFRTANGGALWTPCGDYYGAEFTGSIAVSATQPNLVYVKPSG